MLENEPEGGERTGSQPAGETAETSTESTTGAKPVRKRTSRRRAPLNQPEQTDAPVEAFADAGSVSGEAPQAEVLAPVAGEQESTPKAPRRRRKATTAKAVEEPTTATAPRCM